LAQHAEWLGALAASALGWRDATPGRAELDAALQRAGASEPVDRSELLEWLARALDGAGRVPLGGDGGGVQVLSVMEARGLDFERIFALGLCRGSFPRPIREDALLPDRLRRRLRELLPELPIKRDGFDEERFLFAQLLTAAPVLTLSFPSWDAEGKPLAASPLLDALLRAQPVRAAPEPSCATPRERAGLAGLSAPRDAFAGALRVALSNAEAGTRSGVGANELSLARLAALAELDPHDGRRGGAGPLLGFVGAAGAGDPRGGWISVTALEDLARCPWKAFLRRVLRLKPPCDARGALPSGLDARLLGNVVHGALARIVGVRGGEFTELDALLAANPEPPQWPDADALSALLLDSAREVVADEAIALPSYAHALAERARAFVEQARRVDWALGPPLVLGGEASSALALDDACGRRREIHFRADRVDREGGALRLTDYKTGRPPAKALDELAQGKLLQTAVYALAAGEGAQGRYLYLRPDLKDDARVVATPPQAELAPALRTVLHTLLAAWDAGAFVPRLREPAEDREPYACSRCELKDACSRGDSGMRLRLGAWADAPGTAPEETAAHALWRLPEATA
jgi:RecB family exonuclease